MERKGKPTAKDYALKALQEGIERGEWSGVMPSERTLSQVLRVGRNTVHHALQDLQADGWLRVERKRNIILHEPGGDASTRPRRLVLLSSEPREELSPRILILMSELLRHFLGRDVQVDYMQVSGRSSRILARQIERLCRDLQPDLWVLHHAERSVQERMLELGQVCVVLGTCVPDVPFSMIDYDYAAMLQHAMHRLLNLGHTLDRIVLVLPDSDLAGLEEMQTCFASCFEEAEADPWIERLDPVPSEIGRFLRSMLRRSRRPTAILLNRPLTALGLLGETLRLGLRIPGDLSIVCCSGESSFLPHTVPCITHYHYETNAFARRATRLIAASLNRQAGKRREIRVCPEFVKGQTLGKPELTA